MAVRRQGYAQASWLVVFKKGSGGVCSRRSPASGPLPLGIWGAMTHHRPRTQSAKLRIEFSFQLQMLCGFGQSRELLQGVGVYRRPTDADFSLNRCARVKRAAN